MNSGDLLISNRDGIYDIRVAGRANFEYAVPMREIAKNPESIRGIRVDLGDCVAMDSTFMGVLTMLALTAQRNRVTVVLLNASETLVKLLRGLGVHRLFEFNNGGIDATGAVSGGAVSPLKLAETVAEAHQSLVDADQGNAEKFSDVINYAEQDVQRLRGEKSAEK